MRVKRRTLRSEREAGRLYVLLEHDPTTEPERPHDRTHDRTEDLIATLQQQLEAERQAHAEARRLLMAALERIPPQLEAPASPEARESLQTVEEARERVDPHPDTPGAPEGAERSLSAQGVVEGAAGDVLGYLSILGAGSLISGLFAVTRHVDLSLISMGVTAVVLMYATISTLIASKEERRIAMEMSDPEVRRVARGIVVWSYIGVGLGALIFIAVVVTVLYQQGVW
jgi:hypothetical protein